MKKRKTIWAIAIMFLIALCNIPNFILRDLCILLGEGKLKDTRSSIRYITKDKKFPGGYLNIWNDYNSSNYYYYSAYQKAYPEADTTLYRITPMRLHHFWRWAEYIVSTDWHQPYMEMSYEEWSKIQKEMWANREKYGNPFPKDTVSLPKK